MSTNWWWGKPCGLPPTTPTLTVSKPPVLNTPPTYLSAQAVAAATAATAVVTAQAPEPTRFGVLSIENAGQSCYINTALQLVFYMEGLCTDLAALRNQGLARWVGNIGIAHWNGKPIQLKALDVISAIQRYLPQFQYRNIQEDSHEFFRQLLTGFGADNIVKGHLGGRQVFLTTCLVCGTHSPRYEDFDQFQIRDCRCIKDFFEELFRSETMTVTFDPTTGRKKDDRYECAHCNATLPPMVNVPGAEWRTKANGQQVINSDARRELFISRWPKMLLFQIARFSPEPPDFVKLTHPFDFPMFFEDEAGGNPHYRLCFLVIHVGKRGSGHYYAYARHPTKRASFVKYNDEEVTEDIKAEELTTERIRKNVYMLLYERC